MWGADKYVNLFKIYVAIALFVAFVECYVRASRRLLYESILLQCGVEVDR